MPSHFRSSAPFPIPLDYEFAFGAIPPKGPSSLPHPSPSKAFWTHPGLSKDWPQDDSDPEGNQRVNPLAREGSEGPIEHEADIVIIGAGMTGVSVAMELSKVARKEGERMKVVLLEARDFCSGATGRNGGHLTANTFQNFNVLAAVHPPEEVKRCFELETYTVSSLLETIKANNWEEDIDLVRGGRQVLMFTEAEQHSAKQDWEEARNAGIDCANEVEWLNVEETKNQYGAAYPSFRIEGYNLWPLKLVTNMYWLARGSQAPGFLHLTEPSSDSPTPTCAEGVVHFVKSLLPTPSHLPKRVSEKTIQVPFSSEKASLPMDPFQLSLHTQTPVTSVTSVSACCPSPMYDVHTPRGTIRTPLVVYATNAYTSHLLPHLSGPDGIVPVRGQVTAIRANVGYKDEGDAEGITRTAGKGNKGFEYWFPRPHPSPLTASEEKREHRHPLIILGGGRETLREKGYGMYETNDKDLDPEASELLRKFLPTVFPGKFSTEETVEVEWTGIMGFTKSGDPFVGRVLDESKEPVAGQYICAGYTGHGMPRAYGCAKALASLIWADKNQNHWSPPHWFPRHYLTQEFK